MRIHKEIEERFRAGFSTGEKAKRNTLRASLGSIDLAYSPAIPVRFFAWIRRPHSARSLRLQECSSSASVAAILGLVRPVR